MGKWTHIYRWVVEHGIAAVSKTALTLFRSPDPKMIKISQMTSTQGKYLFCDAVSPLAVWAIAGYCTARYNENTFEGTRE